MRSRSSTRSLSAVALQTLRVVRAESQPELHRLTRRDPALTHLLPAVSRCLVSHRVSQILLEFSVGAIWSEFQASAAVNLTRSGLVSAVGGSCAAVRLFWRATHH
jgi:hypothetical protein